MCKEKKIGLYPSWVVIPAEMEWRIPKALRESQKDGEWEIVIRRRNKKREDKERLQELCETWTKDILKNTQMATELKKRLGTKNARIATDILYGKQITRIQKEYRVNHRITKRIKKTILRVDSEIENNP